MYCAEVFDSIDSISWFLNEHKIKPEHIIYIEKQKGTGMYIMLYLN